MALHISGPTLGSIFILSGMLSYGIYMNWLDHNDIECVQGHLNPFWTLRDEGIFFFKDIVGSSFKCHFFS